MKLFILRVQSLAGERIPMLPADETAYTAGRSVDDPQTGGISQTPDDAFGMRGGEFTMQVQRPTVWPDRDERIVKSAG